MPNYKDFDLDIQNDNQKFNTVPKNDQRTITKYVCTSDHMTGSCRFCCYPEE